MVPKIKLFCVIDKDATIFPVEVAVDDSVGDLKKIIKNEKPIDLADVDADKLNLWKISIPSVPKRIFTLDNLEAEDKTELDDSTADISELFDQDPPKKTIHIIIERPLRDVCSSTRSSTHPQHSQHKMTELLTEIGELKRILEEVKLNSETTLVTTQRNLQRKEAILTQTYKLHEYPIPRLFIVVPDDGSEWDSANLFEKTYRLYFLCECDTVHFALHEGHIIKQPNKFFRQYGGYLKTMIAIAKTAAFIAGFTVPQVAHLEETPVPDCYTDKGHWDTFIKKLDWMDQKLEDLAASQQGLVKGSQSTFEGQRFLDRLEGASLRELEGFLQNSNTTKKLGNLFRVTTNQDNAKWVCLEHFDKNYNYKQTQRVKRAVKSAGGNFDTTFGKATFRDLNIESKPFEEAYNVMKNGGVQELEIDRATMKINDANLLADMCSSSNIQILNLDQLDITFSLSLSSKEGLFKTLLGSRSIKSVKSTIFPVKTIAVALKHNNILEAIDLSKSNIGDEGVKAIGEALKSNITLTTIRLCDNEISDEGGKAIGEVLKSNTALTTIDLRGNNISDISGCVIAVALTINTTLTTIDLNNNPVSYKCIEAIGEALKSNTTLATINLENNIIGDEGGKAIGEALTSNKTLKTISLSASNIGDEGGRAIGEALKRNITLTTIDLSYNNIGPEGVKTIGEALRGNFYLTTISLDSNNIGDEGGKAIGKALRSSYRLTTISLDSNNIGDEGEALKSNATLTTIDLSHNSIGPEGVKAIGEALKSNATLTTIDLSHNNIGPEGVKTIGEALKSNTTLTTIRVSGNEIGDEGVKAIVEALKCNTTLTTINLNSNKIGDEGGKTIGEALKINTTLATINLQYNKICSEGGKAIGEALKSNTALRTINLDMNNIGSEGGKAIGEALKDNTTLTTISLIRNNISSEGGKAIGEALKSNTTLTTISLSRNNISSEGGKAIGEALKSNTTLATIDLSDNKFGDEGGKAIEEALRSNTTLTTIDLKHNNIGGEEGKAIEAALKNITTVGIPLRKSIVERKFYFAP
ncbi:hypothetical protein BGZ46_008990 [Entomortierella lignicola]|nr:hypothetical protein BGZ46_008990 [Entomortierella lignicola]